MRDIVFGLVGLAALCKLSVYVANVAGNLLGLAHGFEKRLFERRRVIARVFARLPLNLQRFATLHRRPGVVSYYSDSAKRLKSVRRLEARDDHGLLHARHLASFLIVEGLDLAAKHR